MYNSDLNTNYKKYTPQVVHAEVNTVFKLKKSEKNKPIDTVVFRTNKNGSSLLLSKLYDNCKSIMNKISISKNWKPRYLIYTNEAGSLTNDSWLT